MRRSKLLIVIFCTLACVPACVSAAEVWQALADGTIIPVRRAIGGRYDVSFPDVDGSHAYAWNVTSNATAQRVVSLSLPDAALSLSFPSSGTHSGMNTGDQTITLEGDVTGSGTGSFAATIAADAVTSAKILDGAVGTDDIADDAVTFAKMQTVQSSKFLGRASGGAGDVEQVGIGGGLEMFGGNLARSAITGDVTLSLGGTTADIAFNAVTYAKLQNVSATDRLLGRDTAGAGDVEELTASGGLEFTGTGIQRSALTGDVTATAGSNATTIAADAVALGTDTTGGYAASATEGGAATSVAANSVTLTTHTTGDYVATIAAGSGIATTGAASGEGIAHSISVSGPASGLTGTGALNSGSITSGFGSIDLGADNFTTTGTVSSDTLTLTNTGTLNGLDAIDATGEATLESTLDIAGDVASTGMGSTVVQANAVALGTDTTGNYALGDAEGGAATTGDSATAFFSAGTLEVARGGTGAGALTDLIALSTHTTGNYANGTAEAGDALAGDSATAFFAAGQIESARGGTGVDSSGTTGFPVVVAGAWSFLSWTGSGDTVRKIAPTISSPVFVTNATFGANGVIVSDDGDGAINITGQGDGFDESITLNLDDTANTLTVTSSTGLNVANFSGIALQESGNAVPNVTDNLSVFAATTSAQLPVSDETGTGVVVYNTSPVFSTAVGVGITPANAMFQVAESGATAVGTSAADTMFSLASDSQGADSFMMMVSTDDASSASKYFLSLRTEQDSTPDNEFLFTTQGNAYADGAWNGGGADVAEYFRTADRDLLPRGTLVAVAGAKRVKPADGTSPLIGVVSTNPGLITNGGDVPADLTKGRDKDKLFVLVGLLGQVPTRVTGAIAAGDGIAVSDKPGVGRKAVVGEAIVGVALEDWTGSGEGKIDVFIK